MQVSTVSDPEEFMANAGDLLYRHPVHNNVLLFHAVDPAGLPPGTGQPVFAWVTDPGGTVVGAAFAMVPYRMTLSEMPVQAARALADHFAEHESWLPGASGPDDTASAFAARWSEITGQPARREREQWLMRCDETTRQAPPPGRPRLATAADLDAVAEWFSATMRHSGLDKEKALRHTRHMAEGQLAGKRLIVWEGEDGKPLGAAGWAPPIGGVVRPSGVFVAPEARDGGYATALLGEVTARALEEGADTCVCTHYLAYASMLAVVEKVGYQRVMDLTEYRFG
ncbi:GNAT family N-acetyltransferase [Actinoallomurus bryophytorum]|uniref:Putative GNAT family acetyltransferase n=1 Tax=Actinoallomurus bryophytorum TaxID=1490222 RepID=A0A543CUY0_9ACTN|nr:putative GNAT family acetyltransferase [Actinoallomurus bryophytorum]